MTSALLAALSLLSAAPASAARYDPDADRAALRQAATLSNSAVVDATGLPLEPERAAAISSGLDEGLRQARLAADAARALDEAARLRGSAMADAVKESVLDRAIKDLSEPVAAERRRWQALSSEREALEKKAEGLPEEERAALRAPLSKAGASLRAAAGLLAPLEDSVGAMGEAGLEMKSVRLEALAPLVELSSAAAGAILRAGDLAPALAEAKPLLGALDREPRAEARTRAWEKLEPLRGITRLLFQDADRACNRADEFRRRSSAFERAAGRFDGARRGASGPGPARLLLDAAGKSLAEARDRLKPSR